MNTDAETIRALQASVSAHLMAAELYGALEATTRTRYQLAALAEHWAGELADELEHLKRLRERLEWFGEAPTFDHDAPAPPRDDFATILGYTLAVELTARQIEQAGILTARLAGDEGTAGILAANLAGSEESVNWLEAQQRQIAMMGMDNWLADQR